MKTNFYIQKEIISHLKSSARSAQGLLYSIGLVVTLLLVGTGNVWGTDFTWTCTSGTFSTEGAALSGASSSDIIWTASQTGTSQGTGVSGEKCVQIAKSTGLTLQTSSISGTISSITLQTWGNQGNDLTCTVGSVSETKKIPTSYSSSGSTVTFSPNASGTITFTWASASRAFNVRKINITYSTGATATLTLKLPKGDGTFVDYETTDKSKLADYDFMVSKKLCYGSAAFEGGSWNTGYWTDAFIDYDDATSVQPTRYSSSSTFSTDKTLWPLFVYGSTPTYYHTDPYCPTFHVYYDGNGNTGGSAPSDATDYDGGETVTVKSATLTKTNYTFTGWNTESDGSGTHYAASGSATFTITEDVTLYAEWCRDLSTASDFSLNTSSLSSTGVTISWNAVTDATKYDLRLYDKNLGFINTYSNLASTSQSVTGLTAGTGYHAEVLAKNDCNDTYKASSLLDFTTKHVYTIAYYKNDGSGTSETESKTEGVNYTISSNKFSRDGYTLSKWNTQAGGGGTDYTKGATYSKDAPLDLYAVWSPESYTITLNGNGGSGNPASVSATYGAAAPSVGTLPTKADQDFAGYWTGEGGTGTMVVDASGVWVAGISGYTDGSKNWIGTEGKTIYAKWVDKTYTNYRTTCSETYDIVLHDNNGGSHNGSAKVADGGKLLTNIVAPTRDGYYVEGYYTEAGTSTKIATASGELQSDKTGYTDATSAWTKGDGATLYAKWTATNYTITYEGLEGASNTNPTSYTIETATIVLANPGSREGYTFAGWTCGGTPITQITVGSTGDKTITAKWTPITYQVRFNANGGGGSMSPQNFTYGRAQNLTSNSFTHATKSFGGWATSAANSNATPAVVAYTNGQNVNNLSSTNGAVVDLYAVWVDCDLYTVTLNVNGDTWKTVTQGSCDASIDLSGYQDVPSCGGGYTFVGWSETNSADPMFDAPAITKTSSYTPESNVTLYAVYSYSAKIGTKVMNLTDFGGSTKPYILVANNSNVAMKTADDTVHVAKSAIGDALIVTSSNNPKELYFSDAGSSKWFIYSPYKIGSNEYFDYEYYYAPSGSGGRLSTYGDTDYAEWYIDINNEYTGEDNIKSCYGDCYYEYDEIESFMKANGFTNELWSVSVNNTGVATITAVDAESKTRTWYYRSSKTFKTYSSAQSPVALYEYNPSGTAYTTQPSMTVYSIAKGAETNGTYTISAGVVCSGQTVDLSATSASGYAFSGWSSSNGGSFGDASSASTTYTIGSDNTILTASFVAVAPHAITWMVNGSTYTAGDPTSSLTAGTSFSTMTLPTAPANNTLSSACGAVANTFVGWSTTDMGFATGQSAPAKLFTNAAGAGSAYGNMGDADVTFYAVFAQDGSSNYMSRCADTYSITLDKKEGTTDGTAVATEMGSALDITLAPTYAGHSVEGYYAEIGMTTKIANADGSLIANKSGYTDGSGKWINTTAPLTLYTNWTLNSHTLTWNLDGGAISVAGTAAGTVAYGTALVAPEVTKTGYRFNAWSPAVDATMPDNDVTYTATWTPKQYAITYKDKDDAVYSGDQTDGRPTGCPANHTYGSATDLPYGVKAGYRFDGWFTTSACTGDPITSIASNAEGPFTLYAKWTASHTFTFSKNGVVDGTLTLGQVEGGNVVMPNTTVDCGLWTTFEGWVIGDVAETTTEPATIYKPGDIFVAGNSNQEFKAVYSKHEGDASVYYKKVTSNSVTPAGEYVIASPDGKTILTGLNGNARGTYESVTISDNIISNKGNGAVLNVNKKGSKFNIKISGDTKYITSCDNTYFEYSVTDGASACMWELTNEGYIHSTDNTNRYIEFLKSGTQYFGTYTGNQWKSFLYRKRVAGTTYYATAPGSCEVPTEIMVSYNDNKANAGNQTISGMPSGTTLTFTSYPNFASYSVGAAPTDPTGYHFAGWNTSADGSGDDYTVGASVTTFGYKETITLYAQWERVYTVTLMDNGVERTRLTETNAGAGVTLPDGLNCTPSSEFTFVGWTESSVRLNGDPVRPTTLHAAGSYVPTSDITLYSVYSKSVAGCDDFAAGVSGAYTMYYDGSNYATTGGTSDSYTGATSGIAEVFYIAYAPAHTGYTIRTSIGFVGWNHNGSELTKGNTTPYYWKISGSSSNWVITPEPSAYTNQLKSSDGSKFQLYAAATSGKLLLQRSAMTYYYNTAICEAAQITFHDGGGTISGTPTTPDGASWNNSMHVLSGLEDCDKITTFPTASYDGWTFVGWSTEDYSNSGKHVADYAGENASTDEPDASIIYKTGSNPYVVRGGSIDLYPVFTRFEDNEPFNTASGGDYYIYYLKPGTDDGYGANIRVYAGKYINDKRYDQTTSCAAATEFTFTKEGDVWHIYDKITGKYVAGVSGDDDLVHRDNLDGANDDWTITIKSGNQFYASCQEGGRYISFSTSANYFMDYSTTSNQGICLPVYLGSCTERIFSSEPNPTPTIDLTGEPMVTSSVGQQVRATETMTLSASHLASVPADRIKVSGTNLKFATSATESPVENLFVNLTSGSQTIYVYYTPTATEDGLENIIVTAQAYHTNTPTDVQTTGTVHARHLPADFVIAAKIGDKWYALPADINSSSANTTGVLIEVDNAGDPTAATAAPKDTKWGLRNVRPKRQTTNGLGDHLTFTERATTATADNQKTLYNGSGTSIQTSAQWSNYAETNPEKYEWIPTTADFKDYTLTSAAETRTLSLNTSGVFGSLTQAKAYDGKVRLLPASFYEPAEMQVVEWKANSVVVLYTGSGTTATTKVGTGSESSAQSLSSAKVDHGVFELTTGTLTDNANKVLTVTIKNGSSAFVGKTMLTIPAIVSGSTTAPMGIDAAATSATDVVVLDGATLSAAATKYTFKNITVYPGGKLVIGSGKQLGMASLTLRGGSAWGAATYEHKYPQFVVNNATDGAYSNTSGVINYDYVTTKDQYYSFVLPYDGSTSAIKYPLDIYGSAVSASNTGSFEFQYYDGAARAAGGTGWKVLAEPATLVAGTGYTFLGMPKKVDAYDGTDDSHAITRQRYGIHRIPMNVAAATVQAGETNNKTAPLSVTLADKNNNSGWNLVGNPFMVTLSGLGSDDIQVGKLVHTDTNPWDGKWRWDPETMTENQRFVVIPGNDGQTYESELSSSATLPAFKNFFVQIGNESADAISFSSMNRVLAPARYMDETEQDIRLAVDLVSEARKDKVDLLINDIYSAAFDINGDFTKMMNGTNFNLYGVYPEDYLSFIAVDKTTAAGSIAIGYQVPAGGDYTLQLSDREYVMTDAIEALYVTDHEVSPEVTTDLLDGPYNFHVNNAETNNTRFTVSIRLAPMTPTDIGNVPDDGMSIDNAKPRKFIWQDKMYILRNGVIYDATGKQVGETNK